MAQVTVQQILQQGDAAFERSHPLPGYVRKAVWALLAWRTAVLGGQVQRGPDGPFAQVWYRACRHRLCPPCAGLQVERWLERQQARLLAGEHAHGICTWPDERRGCWLANRRAMPELLLATGRATRFALLGDATSLGARPGMLAALHTWSQTVVCQPQRHGLVTGGGMTGRGSGALCALAFCGRCGW
jgi:hypothetical protein